jgi:putative transposase
MKNSRFTEAQIIFAIKQSATGVQVAEICRKMGISEATFYNWKKKYVGLGVAELRERRQLKDGNSKLKQMVADLSLDKQTLQDVIKKSFEDRPNNNGGKEYKPFDIDCLRDSPIAYASSEEFERMIKYLKDEDGIDSGRQFIGGARRYHNLTITKYGIREVEKGKGRSQV